MGIEAFAELEAAELVLEVSKFGSIIAEAIFTAATVAARPTTSAASGPVKTALEAVRVRRHNSIAFRRTQKMELRMKTYKEKNDLELHKL